MKFLLDTNILIPAEPTSPGDLEPGSAAAVELLRVLATGRHDALVHPGSVKELLGDKNIERRDARRVLVEKYPRLDPAPPLDERVTTVLGTPEQGSHDEVDLQLLSAVIADAVDYLVTEDRPLRRRAARMRLTPRVATVSEAVALVRALFPQVPTPPPSVNSMPAYSLNEEDPIFDSFREDYPRFDEWLAKCKREHRQAWAVESNGGYSAVAIVKEERTGEHGLRGRVVKICSFKVARRFTGFRYGELLLKTIFRYAAATNVETLYVEVFPRHLELVELLEDFGFREQAARTQREELVMVKELVPSTEAADELPPLDFHVLYGPPRVKVDPEQVFVVPIKPLYDELLFPDVSRQPQLIPRQVAYANGIRKAYLCGSKTRSIRPGALLLFYRSGDERSVRTFGVVEDTLVSSDSTEIARFVGKRTVYSFEEIRAMTSRPVLSVLFRHARVLGESWTLSDLVSRGVLSAAPRSIVRVKETGAEWLRQKLSA